MTILVCDIGGTYMRLATSVDGQNFRRDPQKIKTSSFQHIADALKQFVQQENIDCQTIKQVMIAQSDRNTWVIDKESIYSVFPEANFKRFNDFEANAYGLVNVTADDIHYLAGEQKSVDKKSTRAVIGSGTGIGLAYITASGEVLKTHGGHMLPALPDDNIRSIFKALQDFKKQPSVMIYEDALGGDGIYNIYRILSKQNHLDCEFSDVVHMLTAGAHNPLVQQTLKFYHEILGLFLHHVVAFGRAYGGVFLTGGVTDRLINLGLFDIETVLHCFYQDTVPIVTKDVVATPIFWVKDEFISLKGLLTAGISA